MLRAAAALLVLLVVPGHGAAKRQRPLELTLSVYGVRTVHVTGDKPFACGMASCRHTFRVRPGRRILVRATSWTGWKLTRWAGACEGSGATCSLLLRRSARASVTFVPPGARSNPYPLGTSVKLDGAWRLTVNSATLDADAQVEPSNPPLPAGSQYALVNVSLTYVGTGTSNVASYVDEWLGAVGPGNVRYQLACTPPPLDLSSVADASSQGQTLTGNLCFEIASSDASGLLLFGTATTPEDTFKNVYFALGPGS